MIKVVQILAVTLLLLLLVHQNESFLSIASIQKHSKSFYQRKFKMKIPFRRKVAVLERRSAPIDVSIFLFWEEIRNLTLVT
jgi:hypothetical protein